MKHIKLYEDFVNESKLNEATKLDLKNDIFDSGLGGYKDWSFDPAKKKLTVTYDIGKWDNKGRYEKEIKWLATNDRSAMTSGNSLVGHLDLYLQPHGLEVDKKKQHKYDAAKGRVELNLTDAHPDNHWYGHSVWENDESQTNEASTPGRAWSGALSNVDKLFAWMYDNGILSKSEKAEKDRIFSQYYRWYNDGDFPAALRSMGVSKGDSDAVIEKALEGLVEKFMKEVLNKYTGKYDRKEFHIDTLLGDLNTLENIVAGYKDPNGRGEPDPYGLLNYWGKKINTGDSDFEKLLGELGPLYKDVSDSTNKAFDAAGENIGSSYTIAYRRELAKGKGIWTPELEKKYMKMKNHMLRMHNILKKVIEATQRARVAILDRQGISKY
jgi:hypothetical protein